MTLKSASYVVAHFRFNVFLAQNDSKNTRRYLDSSSLVGSIRRLSSNPLAAADLSLPEPGTNGSLSHNADIVVDAANQASQEQRLLLQGFQSVLLSFWDLAPMMHTAAFLCMLLDIVVHAAGIQARKRRPTIAMGSGIIVSNRCSPLLILPRHTWCLRLLIVMYI